MELIKYYTGRTATTAASLALIAAVLLLLGAGSELSTGAQQEQPTTPKKFTIMHTNDEHSAVIPHSPALDYTGEAHIDDGTLGGFSRLASAVKEIRSNKKEKGEPVLLLNGGDFLGGSPFGWLAPEGYATELNIMQKIGYDAVVIGNHEYDYGPEVLSDYLLAAGYPEAHVKTTVLASNTKPPGDHPLSKNNLLRSTEIFELENGLTIGTFGLIGRDAVSVTYDTGEIEFKNQEQTAKKYTQQLKKEGVDVIIALTHSGIEEDKKLAAEVEDLDIIVGGHCHTALQEPLRKNETIIVQAGSLLKYLGLLELSYYPDDGEITVRNREKESPFSRETEIQPEREKESPFLIPIDSRFPPDEKVENMVLDYKYKLDELVYEFTGGDFEKVLHPVAHSDFKIAHYPPLQETPAGNFVTDAMYQTTEEVTGEKVDVALQANGVIRKSIIPSRKGPTRGEISLYEIAEACGLGYGFDGYAGFPVVSTYLTGEELQHLLELGVLLQDQFGDTFFLQYSGLRYDYNPNNAVLFTLPVVDQPLPAALFLKNPTVTSIELYTGEEMPQSSADEHFTPLEKGDEKLYHLVTDYYVLSFLPMVGDMLPRLEIIPKDGEGNPVPEEDFHELVVHHDKESEKELKVWEAAARYAASFPEGENDLAVIPEDYRETGNRINKIWTFPLVAWPALALLAAITGAILLIRRRRRRFSHLNQHYQ